MSVQQAMAEEAAGLNDAEVDTRVFYNQSFEARNISEHIEVAAQPSPIKMNGFFGGAPIPAQQTLGATPGGGYKPASARKAAAGSLRGTPNGATPTPTRGARGKNAFSGQTLVETFGHTSLDDDDDAPGAAHAAAADDSSVIAKPRGVGTARDGGGAASADTRARAKAWEVELVRLIGANKRAQAITMAAPAGAGLIKCYLKRSKSLLGGPSFSLHLEDGDVFLLASKRRSDVKHSSFIICTDPDDLNKKSASLIGKLKSNFMGSQFVGWGKSRDPSVHKGFAHQDVAIAFAAQGFAKSGPRKMHAAVPRPESGWQPSAVEGGPDSLLHCLQLAHERSLPPQLERNLILLANKAPEYDEAKRAYTLDFHGRVKEASVKNFQLVMWDHNADRCGSEVVMQFGRVSDETFSLDFSYPLCIRAALSIALASIDTKLLFTL